ncbi:MAG: hypothetical protein AB7J35_08750 [Dehalococcoidia bacterium]
MKWLGRLVKKLVRVVVATAVLTTLVILLDALLSPDGREIERP